MRILRSGAKVGALAGAVLLFLCLTSADARHLNMPGDRAEAWQESELVHRAGKSSASLGWDTGFVIGDLWFPYISNKGFFGLAISTAEYPGGSNNSHLWQGGLWLGGRVDTLGTGVFTEGAWTAIGTFDQLHFFGYDALGQDFVDVSEGCMRAVQTQFNTAYSPRDLDVTVEMTLRAWDQPGYDDFLVIEHELTFGRDLEGFFFGWMSDFDVGNNVFWDYAIDDLVGYDAATGLAYMYDGDGDPIYPDQPDGEKVSTTVIGQMLLEAPAPGGSVTATPLKSPSVSWAGFNWWDWNSDVTGESDAYDRLSSTEKDIALPSSPFDYRVQTGVGPYSVRAGDTARFVIAYVLGEGVTPDRAGPLGALTTHAGVLSAFYADSYALTDISPSMPVIEDPEVSGLSAVVSWSTEAETDPGFSHYNIYRSRATAVGPWEEVGELTAGASSYELQIEPGFEQFFLVTSESATGKESNRNSAWSKTLDPVEGSVRPATTLDRIAVAPNPYVGSAGWELVDYEGKIMFSNLPERCTLRIFNLAGDLIYETEHHSTGRGTESWNLLTYDRQSVASGLYLYSVEAPGLGQKVGKFAIINGQR